MWEINIFRKSSKDHCKPALQALRSMFKDGSAKIEPNRETLDGVSVYAQFGKVDKAVAFINAAGYETDEDEV